MRYCVSKLDRDKHLHGEVRNITVSAVSILVFIGIYSNFVRMLFTPQICFQREL